MPASSRLQKLNQTSEHIQMFYIDYGNPHPCGGV